MALAAAGAWLRAGRWRFGLVVLVRRCHCLRLPAYPILCLSSSPRRALTPSLRDLLYAYANYLLAGGFYGVAACGNQRMALQHRWRTYCAFPHTTTLPRTPRQNAGNIFAFPGALDAEFGFWFRARATAVLLCAWNGTRLFRGMPLRFCRHSAHAFTAPNGMPSLLACWAVWAFFSSPCLLCRRGNAAALRGVLDVAGSGCGGALTVPVRDISGAVADQPHWNVSCDVVCFVRVYTALAGSLPAFIRGLVSGCGWRSLVVGRRLNRLNASV